MFVSLTIKAVQIEPVSELTTAAFVATLRRFIARRGKPTHMKDGPDWLCDPENEWPTTLEILNNKLKKWKDVKKGKDRRRYRCWLHQTSYHFWSGHLTSIGFVGSQLG